MLRGNEWCNRTLSEETHYPKRPIIAANAKRNTVNLNVSLQNVLQSIFISLLLHRKKPPCSAQQHRKDPMSVWKRFARVNTILTKTFTIYIFQSSSTIVQSFTCYLSSRTKPIINLPPLTSLPSLPNHQPRQPLHRPQHIPRTLPVQRRNPLPMQCPYVLIQRL